MTRIIIPNIQKMTDVQTLTLMKIFDEHKIYYIIAKDKEEKSFMKTLFGRR